MPQESEPKYRRQYTKDQLKGRHHLTLQPSDLNEAFLEECTLKDRNPSDLLRVILKERYSSEVHYPKSVEVKPHGDEQHIRKRQAV